MTSKPTRTVPEQRVGEGTGGPTGTGGPARGQPVRDSDVTWATSGYLGAVFLGPVVPLFVYLTRGSKSPFLRYHAAMAANLSLTGILYGLCCLIIGGLLVLDSVAAALIIALPLVLLVWLLLLRNLIRGVTAASRGEELEVPPWLCARMIK